MIEAFREGRCELHQALFDFQPTSILILSATSEIILANRAARQLFHGFPDVVGNTITSLPIKNLDANDQSLKLLLPQSICNGQQGGPICKYDVEICGPDQQRRMTASLLVSNFDASGGSFRMLSFEHVRECSLSVATLNQQEEKRSSRGSDESHNSSPNIPSKTIRPSVKDGTALRTKFLKLCDAIYHAEDRSGFLLSADNKFCYPNYRGSRDVSPMEIEDVDEFFKTWEVWTPDFSMQLPLSEYPSLRLNRERQAFRDKRYGLKEDGKNLVLLASGTPLLEPVTGEYLGGVVWLEILGERHDVEAMDLKKSLVDFQNICDRLPHLLWTVDADGRADYFSQSWYDFTGLTQKQSLGLAFTDAIDPVDMEKIWTEFHKAKLANTEVQIEAKYRRYDGQWIWMYVRARPLLDGRGNVLKWYGTSTDIHRIVQEREMVEKRKNQLIQMLAECEIGLFEATYAGEIKVLEGRTDWLNDFNQPHMPDKVEERLKEYFRSVADDIDQIAVFEEKIGPRWYKFRLIGDIVNKTETPKKRKILGCSVDVTEQKEHSRLEMDNTRLANAAALESEKGRLKTQFLAHMSHEIRTPIAGIIGITEMLADSCTNPMQREWIADLHSSAGHLLTIVNDILDLSKIEAGKLELENVRYDMCTLVKQVRKLFTHVARNKSLDLKLKVPPGSRFIIIGDRGRVRQILNNLVSNALKFTRRGFINISIEQRDNELKLVVQDSGVGIDDVTMAKLFKPFVQGDASTSRRYGGTGLGLSISRDLASMMGGTLYLESLPSIGTKAILTLPRTLELEDSVTSSEEDDSSLSWELVNSFKALSSFDSELLMKTTLELYVLVVEDNPINQKVILNLVSSLGYPTKAVWNGQEALDFLEDQSKFEGEPGLVLMDCQMPQLDGYEATRRLRTDPKYEKSRNLPVIALTASTIQGDREKCQSVGMDGYLSKPVSKRQMQSVLGKWIPSRIL